MKTGNRAGALVGPERLISVLLNGQNLVEIVRLSHGIKDRVRGTVSCDRATQVIPNGVGAEQRAGPLDLVGYAVAGKPGDARAPDNGQGGYVRDGCDAHWRSVGAAAPRACCRHYVVVVVPLLSALESV